MELTYYRDKALACPVEQADVSWDYTKNEAQPVSWLQDVLSANQEREWRHRAQRLPSALKTQSLS